MFWFQITDSIDAPGLAFTSNVTSAIIAYQNPPTNAQQLGSLDPVKVSRTKVHSGFVMDSVLTFVYCRGFNSYSVIVLNRLDLRTNTVDRNPWGNSGGQMDFRYPSIAFNGDDSTDADNLVLGFLRSSSGIFPEIAAVHFDDGAFWQNSTVVKVGEGPIDHVPVAGAQERWGDYTTIQRRYNSFPSKCWLVGEYPNGANANWSGVTGTTNTFIAELGDSLIQSIGSSDLLASQLSIYPNPSSGSLWIESISPDLRIVKVTIRSMSGQTGYAEHCYNGVSHEIGFIDLPAGMYLVEVEDHHKYLHHKKVVFCPHR